MKVFDASGTTQFTKQRISAKVVCPDFDPDMEFHLLEPSHRELMSILGAQFQSENELVVSLMPVTLVDADGNRFIDEETAAGLLLAHPKDLAPLVDAVVKVSGIEGALKAFEEAAEASAEGGTATPS